MKLNEESLGFGLINDENNLVALTQKSIICQVLSKPLGKFAVAPLSSLHHHMDKHTGPPLSGLLCPDRIKWGGIPGRLFSLERGIGYWPNPL